MYDLTYFRNNLNAIAARLMDRGFTVDLEAFRKLDAERRAAVSEAEALKAQKNTESAEIGKLKRAGADTAVLQQRVRELDSEFHLRIARLSGSVILVDALKANQLVRLLARGSLIAHDKVMRSLKLLCQEVMPAFR